MKPYRYLRDDETKLFNKRGGKYKKSKVYSDTIYSFDIEVSNLLYFDGKWQNFDKSKSKEFYREVPKLALPYIWMFGVNDQVYYGREFIEFADVLEQISNPDVCKLIYVHNLTYEFEFLRNIIDTKGWTIDRMCCRDVRKPISFQIKELNIEFRCSYMLTNMNLERAAEEYTDYQKLDTLAYDDKVRTPYTQLSNLEMDYCEHDILCVYGIIDYYKKRYKNHIVLIPLTSTGEVRKMLRESVDYYHIMRMQKLVPDPSSYLQQWACFSGGYTHTNILNAGKVITHAKSMDICSDYPWQMLHKLPSTQFYRCFKSEFNQEPDRFAYIALVKFKGVRSKYYTTYMQVSKCIHSKDPDECKDQIRHLTTDNGRVVMSKEHSMWLTNIDYDIIMKNYDIDEVEIIEAYRSKLAYLDKRIINVILDLYENKTSLKGIPEKADIYKRDKAMLNSLYGMCVTNPLKQSADFIHNEWDRKALTAEFIASKIDEMRHSYSTLMFYGQGIWITARARKQLFDCLLPDDEELAHEFDKYSIYSDTDSIKYYGDFDFIFEDYNKKVLEEHEQIAKDLHIDVSRLRPKDIKNIEHPIGVYEYEGMYDELKCLRAKNYCYRQDGKLHITVSGVSKKGVEALNDDINNFHNGFTFDYDHSGKLTHLYLDDMPDTEVLDADGNIYVNKYKHGIILMPTTYTIGVTDLYEVLIRLAMLSEYQKEGL